MDDKLHIFESSDNNYPARKSRRIIIAPIILAIAFLLFQFLSADKYINPETGQVARVGLSIDQEASLGINSYREVLSQSEVIRSGPQLEMARRVANNLIKVVDSNSKSFDWAVELIESEQMNAFCLPGGKIAVYTGILKITRDDDGLAAVMGHEIAHATSRHGSQRLFQQNLIQTAMLGVSGATMEMDQRERRLVLGLLGAGVQYGLILPYGREHESEADQIGLAYLIRAGYKPEAAVEFWQRMEEAGKVQPPEWASTHPSHGTRIANLKSLIAEYRKNGTIAGLKNAITIN